MKKPTLLLTLIVTVLLSLPAVSATAHPGRTDSEGGHVDKSTGQYHYHNSQAPASDSTHFEFTYYTKGLLIIISCTAAAGGVSVLSFYLFMLISRTRQIRRLRHLHRMKSAKKRMHRNTFHDFDDCSVVVPFHERPLYPRKR